MKQLAQDFKSGELKLEEVPLPLLAQGAVLVENAFSLISPGTEKSTIDMAKASLLGKAKKRPDLVRQVMDNIRKEGFLATLQKVNTRLSGLKALGYSSSGIVRESADFENKLKPGDRVACAGQDYAAHAEVIAVPQNLVVKIPDGVSLEEAAFTTLGTIAMQGVRQAEIKLGEKVCLIGLGLLGQITAQILKAGGCAVFGIDISHFCVEQAGKSGIDQAVERSDSSLYPLVDKFTKGYGFDKVIITASSPDNDPVVLATEVLRKKGVMVIVGDVVMNIPRQPHFYKKELELKISTSYGPGRYDQLYEEAGIDYPYPYVRFTENRNMESFLELVADRKIDLKPLITHIFDFQDALRAYELLLNKDENSIGMLLRYKPSKHFAQEIVFSAKPTREVNIGFIGAGNFAQGCLLPCLKSKDILLEQVVTSKSINAVSVARKFGFNSASCNPEELLNSPKINTVFIATQHDTHAKYACLGLKNKKHVFVEKPLAISEEELRQIAAVYKGESLLMVGFNRRFAPASRAIREEVVKYASPLVMNFRVNAGHIPNEHWAQDLEKGGGRVIGEACHFIDLMLYLSASYPVRVFASSVAVEGKKWRSDDNLAVNIEFANGSLGNLVYTAMGANKMGKERLEIFCAGDSFLINDFKEAVFYKGNKVFKLKNKGKGHREEIAAFIKAAKNGTASPIDFNSLLYTSLSSLKILQSLKEGTPQKIDISGLY